MPKPWTDEEIEILRRDYPILGKMAVAAILGRNEGSVRWKASQLGIRTSSETRSRVDANIKAAKTRTGRKRPDQALVIRRLHQEGKFVFDDDRRAAMAIRSKEWHMNNEHPRGMQDKKHSAESKKKMSDSQTKRYKSISKSDRRQMAQKSLKTRASNGTMALPRHKTTWKGGWREIGGQRKYFRSRWEANYARYLEMLRQDGEILSWLHEPEVFWFDGIKRGTTNYLPDFKIEFSNGRQAEYHEVKGWMDDRSKTKLKRMAKYHPGVKLILVDAKEYTRLEKTVSHLIPDWEHKA